MRKTKLFGWLAVAAGVLFGAMGGEYSTWNWWQLKRDLRNDRAAIERLRVETDSLSTLVDALASDVAMQERMAREQFGMIRPGEIVYRFVRSTREER